MVSFAKIIFNFSIANVLDIWAAVIIDWILGDPNWFPHPVIYIGKFISYLEKIGRRLCSSDKKLRYFGGIIVIVIGISSFAVPFVALYFSRKIVWLYHTLNILILWTTIAARCLHKEGGKVYNALKNTDIEDARVKLSYIVGRETKNLNEQDIIRADIETIAENTSDGVIAPLIFGILGGAPLAMLYKGINTMDSMLGYMNEKYRYIGFFPAKTDDVFNYIPARLTGIFICILSPIVGGNIIYSINILKRDRKNHKSPNCGYPESAAAGAMGIQIGGTNVYFGEVVYKPTIGDRKNEMTLNHIKDTIKLMYGSEMLLLLIYTVIVIMI